MARIGHLAMRRAFEDEVVRALTGAPADSVGLMVSSVLGLTGLWHRKGPGAVDDLMAVVLDLARSSAPEGAVVERVGDVDLAVLVSGGTEVAHRVRRELNHRLMAPVVLDGEDVVVVVATAVASAPSAATPDEDMFWCVASRAFAARAATQQIGIDLGIIGEARSLHDAVTALLLNGGTEFELEGALVEIGDRRWAHPEVLPARPADHVFDLRTPWSRIGRWSVWGDAARELHNPWLDELFQCIALVLERALHLEASELRSRRDPLTGLLNRDGLAQAMRDVRPPYAVAVVDIDHFKDVNDRHGHEVGDRFLLDLAGLLSGGRSKDLVARWGGEEMVLVMPGTDLEGAAVALRRLLDEARSTIVADETFLSFSAGVAEVTDDLTGLADGIRAADGAMYEAKREGRGRVVVAR